MTEISLEKRGGVYEVPVRINGALTLNFILDTGASEVNIPAEVVSTLLGNGTINATDFLPSQSYRMADGSTVESSRLRIHELQIGDSKVREVPATVVSGTGFPLLGQSFLGRLNSWSLDNKRNLLLIRAK